MTAEGDAILAARLKIVNRANANRSARASRWNTN